MVYFYSLNTFFSITIALTLVSVVLIQTCLSFTRNPRFYLLWSISAISFLLSWSLSKICPFNSLHYVLRFTKIITLFPCVYTTLILLLSLLFSKDQIRLHNFEKIIIDNLREHLVIFDHCGRVVSYGHDTYFSEIFITNERPAIPPEHPFYDLNAVLALKPRNHRHASTRRVHMALPL